MELKSLSATTLKAWEACPAMAVAQHVNRVPNVVGHAADLGSAVHKALEFYVRGAYIEKTVEPTWSLLDMLYRGAYVEYFKEDMARYDEGRAMLKSWFERTDLTTGRTVHTVEVKSHFMIKTKYGDVPFNYIWDRVDLLDNHDVEIVDYKTWSYPRTPTGLDSDLQMRCYGLAGQIQFPDARKIWVTIDQLRFDSIGTVFTREQNIQTWNYLKEKANQILEMDVDNAPEILNPMCRFCVRRHACSTLNAHAEVQGPLSIADASAATDQLLEVQSKIAGLVAIENDLQDFLLKYAQETDQTEWDTGTSIGTLSMSRRRDIDPQRAAAVIGEELFAQYGKINITAVDALIKSGKLTQDQTRVLKSLITQKTGDPKVKVKARNPLEPEDT